MPKWTTSLVLDEARWAALSPASDGFDRPDPAALVGADIASAAPRLAVLEWFGAAADEAVRRGAIVEQEVASWRARFAPDRSWRLPSTSTTRRHLPSVAAAVADILCSGGATWAAPAVGQRPAEKRTEPSPAPSDAPSTGAQRQSAYRHRRLARLGAVPTTEALRAGLLQATSKDEPRVATAKGEAAQALSTGTSTDVVEALGGFYAAMNDQEDPRAALAAAWGAEHAKTGSVEAYSLRNAAWGVVLRHPQLSTERQPEWARLAMSAAFLELPEHVRRDNAVLRVRHAERWAQAVLAPPNLRGARPQREPWEKTLRVIDALSRDVAEHRLLWVSADWSSVVLKRHIELVLAGRRIGVRRSALLDLARARDRARSFLADSEAHSASCAGFNCSSHWPGWP